MRPALALLVTAAALAAWRLWRAGAPVPYASLSPFLDMLNEPAVPIHVEGRHLDGTCAACGYLWPVDALRRDGRL